MNASCIGHATILARQDTLQQSYNEQYRVLLGMVVSGPLQGKHFR